MDDIRPRPFFAFLLASCALIPFVGFFARSPGDTSAWGPALLGGAAIGFLIYRLLRNPADTLLVRILDYFPQRALQQRVRERLVDFEPFEAHKRPLTHIARGEVAGHQAVVEYRRPYLIPTTRITVFFLSGHTLGPEYAHAWTMMEGLGQIMLPGVHRLRRDVVLAIYRAARARGLRVSDMFLPGLSIGANGLTLQLVGWLPRATIQDHLNLVTEIARTAENPSVEPVRRKLTDFDVQMAFIPPMQPASTQPQGNAD